MKSTIGRCYGWKRDLPDVRDRKLMLPPRLLAALPSSIDLRSKMPAVYDQGSLGSCTANAIAGALHYDELVEGFANPFVPARLFIYWNEREAEGTVNTDSGAAIRDGIKTTGQYGFPPEPLCPYDVSRFTVKPSAAAYAAALPEAIRDYASVNQDGPSIKGALASGHPVIFGFTVYGSFESSTVANSGIMPWPGRNESTVGGHAVLIVGYDDAMQANGIQGYYLVRNSFGDSWGQKGYFWMPQAYAHNSQLASDFWVVNTVPGGKPQPTPGPSPSPAPVPPVYQGLLAWLLSLLQAMGPAALPLIESIVAKLPLPATVIAAIDAILETWFGRKMSMPYWRVDL